MIIWSLWRYGNDKFCEIIIEAPKEECNKYLCICDSIGIFIVA
jgi:hypothetical protein